MDRLEWSGLAFLVLLGLLGRSAWKQGEIAQFLRSLVLLAVLFGVIAGIIAGVIWFNER
ncbi:hypothetical protein [Arenibaculum pallidiluteum]|uniref:hypothetical protein n=1 Tax=Arenibaculum pallidiluteum TaxID=2812559 RepID=UPI001A96024F|nr:hypothetical protein [Arenibaculum pallidiluteum]